MSYQEIGETMGLSVQAVKSLLMRARVNLKNLLDPYLQQGFVPGSPEAIQMEQARMSQFQDAPNESQREEDA
jgi:RNA polymerase sigma-70 factor (ECF subfamily)